LKNFLIDVNFFKKLIIGLWRDCCFKIFSNWFKTILWERLFSKKKFNLCKV